MKRLLFVVLLFATAPALAETYSIVGESVGMTGRIYLTTTTPGVLIRAECYGLSLRPFKFWNTLNVHLITPKMIDGLKNWNGPKYSKTFNNFATCMSAWQYLSSGTKQSPSILTVNNGKMFIGNAR